MRKGQPVVTARAVASRQIGLQWLTFLAALRHNLCLLLSREVSAEIRERNNLLKRSSCVFYPFSRRRQPLNTGCHLIDTDIRRDSRV